MINRSIRIVALVAIFVAGVAATQPNWNATVTQGADGAYTLGNPQAKVKLTEYVSYTCPHCAHFTKEADPTLRLTYVPQGKVAVTVKQILRNPIDVTVAMLTNCGAAKSFFVRHNAFMNTQDKWMAKYEGLTKAQTDRWAQGTIPTRLRAIASDFGFYTTMAQFGSSRAQVDQCLGDPAVLKRIEGQTKTAADLGVDSTPSFAIDGAVLTGTHEWKLLAPQIEAKL